MLHTFEMNNKIAVFISLFALVIVTSGCSNKIYPPATFDYLVGTYESNFSPSGITSIKIVFENKDTCTFVHSRHMLPGFPLKGKYFISKNHLYVKLIEPEEIPNEYDSTFTNLEYFKKFELKEEHNVKYHLKFLIDGGKLYGYNVENDQLVREANTYNEEKGWHMAPYFLWKKSMPSLKKMQVN